MNNKIITLDDEFILGAVNLYEDPHFSFFYLSQSLDYNTNGIYPGYSEIVALYSKGTERYYIKKHETKSTASWILEKIISNSDWFIKILSDIENISSKLKDFCFDIDAQYSTEELLELYEKQYQLNIELYKIARIPEALDRGEPYFTNYLKHYLYEIKCPASDIPLLFDTLTRTSKPSIFSQEIFELNILRDQIIKNYPSIKEHHSPWMLLKPEMWSALHNHANKWGLIHYHGYRNPNRLKDIDFLHRIIYEEYKEVNGFEIPLYKYNHLLIDDLHKNLFYIYSEIGRVKIFRRFCQLHVFYYLDVLLAKIAQKYNTSQIILRYCLPDEITALLSGEISIDKLEFRSTEKYVVHYKNNTQSFYGPDIFSSVETLFSQPVYNQYDKTYYGHCVSLGKVRGPVKKIDNIQTASIKIKPGDIVICQSIDPDYLSFLAMAGGIVTEQGGVASHGSIICRELQIPTISGIPNILELVEDDDIIEIDAFKEQVRIINNNFLSNEIIIDKATLSDTDFVVGNKALNLLNAQKNSLNVPSFHLLSYDSVYALLNKDINKLTELIKKLCLNLNSLPGTKYLLRSSCVFEDSPQHFYAGYFKSFVLETHNSIEAINNFINYNKEKGYRGSIILQEYIDADYCGVCMLGDINYINSEHLVIEYSKGHVNYATIGNEQVKRFIYDLQTQEFVVNGKSSDNIDNFLIDFVNWFKHVQSKFNNPTYIEWGFQSGEFFLYQIRTKHHNK